MGKANFFYSLNENKKLWENCVIIKYPEVHIELQRIWMIVFLCLSRLLSLTSPFCSVPIIFIRGLPCPLASDWVQEMGVGSRRLKSKEELRSGYLLWWLHPCWVPTSWLYPSNKEYNFCELLLHPHSPGSIPLSSASPVLWVIMALHYFAILNPP